MEKEKFFTLHTEEMLEYRPFGAQTLVTLDGNLTAAADSLGKIAESIKEGMLYTQIKNVVENQYDIGRLVGMYQMFGGYVNLSFAIYTEKDGQRQTWMIRKYKKGKELGPLLFEHKLLSYSYDHGFSIGCRPIPAKDGRTYYTEKVQYPDGEFEDVFAIFNFLDGVSTYSWIGNWADEGIPANVYLTAAHNMAMFHSSVQGFDPGELHGDNIMDSEDILVNDLIAKFPETLKRFRKVYAENSGEDVFTEIFDDSYDFMKEMCEKSTIPQADYDTMMKCACQCDFHPANFKYDKNHNPISSFDYDMSKMDSRLFEIGLALHYCFASWKSATNGVMDIERARAFVGEYIKATEDYDNLEPLTETEKKYLYEVTVQGSLYDIAWCTSAYSYDATLDPYEYLYYMQHLISSLHWIDDHKTEFREAMKTL